MKLLNLPLQARFLYVEVVTEPVKLPHLELKEVFSPLVELLNLVTILFDSPIKFSILLYLQLPLLHHL